MKKLVWVDLTIIFILSMKWYYHKNLEIIILLWDVGGIHRFLIYRPLHYYHEEDENALLNRPFNNNYLGNFLHCLVDRLYPKL